MNMYVLDNGIIRMPEVTIYTGGSEEKWIDIPVYSVLIDHPEGLVLFDAACNPEGMLGNWPEAFRQFPYIADEAQLLPNSLERLGYRLEDIRYVVASHLHLDHAGCLKYFPNAEVIVSEVELRNTMTRYEAGEELGAHLVSDIESWIQADITWKTVSEQDGEYPLLDGLTVINLGPGHSWGMLGILVELQDSGSFLLASDALYSARHLGPPPILPAILEDQEGYSRSVQRILKYKETHAARIMYGHDLEQFRGLVHADTGYYH